MSPDLLIGWGCGVLGCGLACVDWSRVWRGVKLRARPLAIGRRKHLKMVRANWRSYEYWRRYAARLSEDGRRQRASLDAAREARAKAELEHYRRELNAWTAERMAAVRSEIFRERMRGGYDVPGLN